MPIWPATQPELRKLSEIRPYPNNPRTHPPEQLALLARMMKQHGVDQPIVVDEDSIILKGHGRLAAAALAEFEEFPVVVHRGLSAAEKTAMRLQDNQVALLSGWDAVLIKGELQTLKLAGFEIPLLGFPESQLRAWDVSLGTAGQADPDAVPDLPKKPVVRRGDLWLLGATVQCPKCNKTGPLEEMVRGKK